MRPTGLLSETSAYACKEAASAKLTLQTNWISTSSTAFLQVPLLVTHGSKSSSTPSPDHARDTSAQQNGRRSCTSKSVACADGSAVRTLMLNDDIDDDSHIWVIDKGRLGKTCFDTQYSSYPSRNQRVKKWIYERQDVLSWRHRRYCLFILKD